MNHTHLLHSLLRGTRTPGRVLLEPEALKRHIWWIDGSVVVIRAEGKQAVQSWKSTKCEKRKRYFWKGHEIRGGIL